MEDAKKAMHIINMGRKFEFDNPFNNDSFIYNFSNEYLKVYTNMLYNKENILSVIASGDQIIEILSTNPRNVDCFDISIFPKYYLMFKIACIKSLTFEEYIFLLISKPEFKHFKEYRELYQDKIRNELDGDFKKFWDYLFEKVTWNVIYKSALFSGDIIDYEYAQKRITNINLEHFYELKKKLSNFNITFYTGNILEIYSKFKFEYDLVYLSNIIDYVEYSEYIKMIKNINLNTNGVVLTYLFNLHKYKYKFNDNNFELEEFVDVNCKSAILKYVNKK